MRGSRLLVLLALSVALGIPALGQDVIRPAEGQELDHIHTRFRWKAFDDLVGGYFLQVFEDPGVGSPIAPGNLAIQKAIPGVDPRMILKEGLEFGKSYAWRVLALIGPAPGMRRSSPIHRFTTKALPTFLPVITVTRPPGAGPMQPGLTLFNRRIGGDPLPGGKGYLIAVDENGKYVWFYEYAPRRITDVRQLDDGRFYWLMNAGPNSSEVGRAVEMTLDGQVTWISPSGQGTLHAHHEVSRMPNGNGLLLTFDKREFPGLTPSYWEGDRIVEVERHTKEVIGTWSAFDHYSMADYFQSGPGGDWTHGNSATFNELDGSVYYSARHLGRITRIDWATKTVVYNMGFDYPSGDATFGHGLFSHQHAPQVLSNGNLLLFDNGNYLLPQSDPRQSAAIEFSFNDPVAPTSTQVAWRYDLVDDLGDPVFSAFLGDADRLANGNTLITAGPNVLIYEVDANSQLVWKIKVGTGQPYGSMYRAERIDSLVKDTPGDIDDDWDLDLRDLAMFQNHFQSAVTGFPQKLSDMDSDGVLDNADFDLFFNWMTGPANLLALLPL